MDGLLQVRSQIFSQRKNTIERLKVDEGSGLLYQRASRMLNNPICADDFPEVGGRALLMAHRWPESR
jgi:hypothetical protein